MPDFFSPLPEFAEICGEKWELDTDFRVWLKIEKILANSDGKGGAALAECMAAAYRRLPPEPRRAADALLWFLSCGRTGEYTAASEDKDADTAARHIRALDAEYDSEYIWSAFYAQYRIDLTRERLHWWKFCALLDGLDKNCRLSQIMAYRCVDLSKISDRETRMMYAKMRKRYALPDTRSEDERAAEVAESFADLM